MPDQASEQTLETLHSRLSMATEQKAPSTNTGPTWFADDDDVKELTPPTGNVSSMDPDSNRGENENGPTAQQPAPTPQPTNTTSKITDAALRASAETATLMYGQVLEVGCTIAINAKFNKRFSEEDKKTIIDKNLEDTPEEAILNEAEKQLAAKWKRLTKNRKRTLDKIPLQPDEEKRLTDGFYNYFKIKNISMPPEYVLFFNLFTTATDRIIETIID